MIRLPNVPGLSNTAVNAPGANPNVARQPGQAMGRLAGAIGAVSQNLVETGIRAQQLENARKESEMRMQLNKDYSNFQIELQKDPDPESRIKKVNDFFANRQAQMDTTDMPPALRDSFRNHFDQFATNGIIQTTEGAAKLAGQRARLALDNELDAAITAGDEASFNDALSRYQATGDALPEEIQKIRTQGMQKIQMNQTLDMIEADPLGWTESNPRDKRPKNIDPITWDRLHDRATAEQRALTIETGKDVQDAIITGDITSDDEIEQASQGLRPKDVQELKEFRMRWNDDLRKKQRLEPEYQDKVVGEFSRTLSQWAPAGEGMDAVGLKLRALIQELPPGSPIREELERQWDEVEQNRTPKATDVKGYASDMVDYAVKSGFFGKVEPAAKIETRKKAPALLGNDILLQTLGFSEKQAKKITKQDTPAEQQALFQELWKERDAGAVRATPEVIQLADAIRLNNAFVQGDLEAEDDRVAQQQAEMDLKVGRIKRHMIDWAKRNPEKAKDEDAMKAELFRVSGSIVRTPSALPSTSKPTRK